MIGAASVAFFSIFLPLLLSVAAVAPSVVEAFGLDDVAARRRSWPRPVPEAERGLPAVDQGARLRPVPRHPLPPRSGAVAELKLPFELMFFHRGGSTRTPVAIHEVTAQGVRDVAFDPDAFDYGQNKIDRDELQAAGLRRLPRALPAEHADVQGRGRWCSSARATSARSARASATACRRAGWRSTPPSSSGEEFPRFVEFWIERPQRGRARSWSSTRCSIRRARRAPTASSLQPGRRDGDRREARLFLRENVAKLGMAPLTSMFFFGENQRSAATTTGPKCTTPTACRSRAATGEWIWRPLVNPKRLLVTSFALSDPRGFGLMQRDRVFAQLRGPRGALRAAALAPGSSRRALGAGPRRAGADPDARRDQRQHRRLLGAARAARAGRAVRLRVSRAVAEGDREAAAGAGCADAPRPWLPAGRRRQHRARTSTSRAARLQPAAAERDRGRGGVDRRQR